MFLSILNFDDFVLKKRFLYLNGKAPIWGKVITSNEVQKSFKPFIYDHCKALFALAMGHILLFLILLSSSIGKKLPKNNIFII